MEQGFVKVMFKLDGLEPLEFEGFKNALFHLFFKPIDLINDLRTGLIDGQLVLVNKVTKLADKEDEHCMVGR